MEKKWRTGFVYRCCNRVGCTLLYGNARTARVDGPQLWAVCSGSLYPQRGGAPSHQHGSDFGGVGEVQAYGCDAEAG
jgi:hypothetical protein